MSRTFTYDGAEPVRVNKWLAQSGACSRREADQLIAAGAVLIDGERVGMLSATGIARRVRGLIRSRPSVGVLADARRDLCASARDELDAAMAREEPKP